MRRIVGFWLLIPVFATGCVSHQRAQNPFPGVFRVAVVPFNNKTAGDEGLSTLDFTRIFASELQKIPTYEVVPMQEVLEVLGPNHPIETNQPELAYALARALHAQAIIVGDITEYKCYYPLRVGLHCEMYAMVTGQPQAVVENPPWERQQLDREDLPAWLKKLCGVLYGRPKHGHHCKSCAGQGHFFFKKHRGKCPDCGNSEPSDVPDAPAAPTAAAPNRDIADRDVVLASATEAAPATQPAPGGRPLRSVQAGGANPIYPIPGGEPVPPAGTITPKPLRRVPWHSGQALDYSVTVVDLDRPRPIIEPWVIRHSRTFDANNLGFVRKIRQYYFFKHDLRGGDWAGYVLRTDDFNRFVCDRMIYEMLEAAGGKWMTLKGLTFPHPWEPWPWR